MRKLDMNTKKIVELYNRGYGIPTIKKTLNLKVHLVTIYRRLEQEGITLRTPSQTMNFLHGTGRINRHKGEHLSPSTEFKKGHPNFVHNPGFKKGMKFSEEIEKKRVANLKGKGHRFPFGFNSWTIRKVTDEYRKECSKERRLYYQNHPESIQKIKEARAKQIFPMRDTSIEVKIQNFLKQLGLTFFTHQYIKDIEHGYQCDIFIPVQEGINQKTIIECDGDAYHFNPVMYQAEDKIFKKGMTAKERWELDQTRTKELQDKGFRVIRLWENEIKVMDINNFQEKL